MGWKKYIKDFSEFHKSNSNLIFYENIDEIKNLSNSEFNWNIVNEIYDEIISQYKTINQTLQKIGLQILF